MKKMFIAIALLFSLTLTSANAVEVTQEAKITGLYVGYFDRAADQDGLEYWTDKSDEVAQAGGDIYLVFKKLSAGFATHPTFKSTYDHLNNKEFVSLIYRNALGRDGDAEGIAYWTKKLDNEGMIRSDMVSDFVELSLVTDLTPENYPNLTEEERAAAQLRQDLITNKVTAALAFTHQLGDKSNVLDSQEPEDDPAYKASIKIISEVREDEQTVSIIIAFLGSIRGYDDPLAMIDSYRGTEEDACISNLTYQNGTIYTFCYIGVPAEVCREIQGSDEEKEWHSFTAEGQCIGLGYPQNSKTLTYGSYTRYHASGLFEELTNVFESSIGTLDLSYDYVAFWKQVVSELEADTYDDAQYLYSVVPDTNQCDMGALSEEAKQRASLVLNHTRELHGLSSLAYNYAFDDEVQASALIMKANNTMTHHPSSDSLCYTQEGYTGSSTSNIFFGHSVIDPAKHIIDWMNDANNVSLVSAVGHRRWMQNPFEKYLAYGQNEGFSALKTFDFDQTFNTNINVDYVAFPYKRYPYVFISNNPEKPTPWSFSIVEKKDNYTNNSFNYFELSSVEVREKMSGALLDISNVYYDKLNYGLSNILTWQIANWQYDTLYEVTVANVHMQSGEIKSFTYDVYIDYKDIVTISRPNENEDYIEEDKKISGVLYDQKDEDSFVVILSGTKVFTGSNSVYSNMGFFINLYDSDKRLIKASDEPFTMTGLNGNYTIVISHSSKEDGYYYTADNTVYTVEITD